MVSYDPTIIEMLIPIMIVLIPALVVYTKIPSRTGFMGGAIIGITLGVSANLLEDYFLIIGIIALASIIFMDYRSDLIPSNGED
jgi:hypothetical protein